MTSFILGTNESFILDATFVFDDGTRFNDATKSFGEMAKLNIKKVFPQIIIRNLHAYLFFVKSIFINDSQAVKA